MLALEANAREVVARWEKGDLAAAIRELSATLDGIAQYRVDEAIAIEKARKVYTDEDIEVDDEPLVSPADEGVWVQAWVWVYREIEGPSPEG